MTTLTYEYDNHEKCRGCKRYCVDCVPPPDVDSHDCKSFQRKQSFNPSKRKLDE